MSHGPRQAATILAYITRLAVTVAVYDPCRLPLFPASSLPSSVTPGGCSSSLLSHLACSVSDVPAKYPLRRPAPLCRDKRHCPVVLLGRRRSPNDLIHSLLLSSLAEECLWHEQAIASCFMPCSRRFSLNSASFPVWTSWRSCFVSAERLTARSQHCTICRAQPA